MLMVVNSVVCHSKLLILTMIEEKLSFGNSLPSFFSEWIVQENNFTQCCLRLGDIILSSFLDAEHPPGTFQLAVLTSFGFEMFFCLYWTPCVNTLPDAAHWWNVQSCPRYKCLAQCSQLGIDYL